MPAGTFFVTMDPHEVVGVDPDASGKLTIRFQGGAKSATVAGDLVVLDEFSRRAPYAVSVSAGYTVALATDVPAGGDPATSAVGYDLTWFNGDATVNALFTGQPAGSTVLLSDLATQESIPLVVSAANAERAEAAADAAAASAAAAATWDPDTYVLHVKKHGAVGDEVTDDTVALRAAVAEFKAYVVNSAAVLSRPIVLDGQGGTYKITGSLDLTGIVLGRGWEIRNLHIVAACPGEIAMDFTGSRFGHLTNVHVWGDQTNTPHTGIALARTATEVCTHFNLDNVTIDGYYTSSALHMIAAEECAFRHCMFVNRRTADAGGESWAAILDGTGYKPLPSLYKTPIATRSSFTVNRFDKCTIQKPFGITGPTMFVQEIASISFESCYLTNGGGSGIVWRLTDGFTPYRVYMDFQCETTGFDRFIQFATDGVTGVHEIRGLHCTHGNMYTDQEVFSLDSGIVSLALRSFRSHIYRWASGVTLANDLFGTPSKVSIYGGDIVVPAASDINAPAAFARFDATLLTMDGSTVNWTYVPTLTNWTLGNGSLTGEYRKVGRQVHYEIRYVVGSTDVPSSTFIVSLPFPAENGTTGRPRGTAHLLDTSASLRFNRFVGHSTSTTIYLADASDTRVAALTPFTFAPGDTIEIVGSYEASS